jgi:hypothetical protein
LCDGVVAQAASDRAITIATNMDRMRFIRFTSFPENFFTICKLDLFKPYAKEDYQSPPGRGSADSSTLKGVFLPPRRQTRLANPLNNG